MPLMRKKEKEEILAAEKIKDDRRGGRRGEIRGIRTRMKENDANEKEKISCKKKK